QRPLAGRPRRRVDLSAALRGADPSRLERPRPAQARPGQPAARPAGGRSHGPPAAGRAPRLPRDHRRAGRGEPVTGVPADAVVVEIAAPGPPEALRPARRPVVPPGPGELLIRVAAAGVNRPDVLQRQGHYPPPPGASDIPGLEVAGEVAAVGDRVTEWRPGDAVCALV